MERVSCLSSKNLILNTGEKDEVVVFLLWCGEGGVKTELEAAKGRFHP